MSKISRAVICSFVFMLFIINYASFALPKLSSKAVAAGDEVVIGYYLPLNDDAYIVMRDNSGKPTRSILYKKNQPGAKAGYNIVSFKKGLDDPNQKGIQTEVSYSVVMRGESISSGGIDGGGDTSPIFSGKIKD